MDIPNTSYEHLGSALRGRMRGGSRKACDIGFLTDGRREVARKRIGIRLCQSMDRRSVYITRLRVPPRAPKRQLKRLSLFCQSILAKTSKTPVFLSYNGKTGIFYLLSVRLIQLQVFPSISVDPVGGRAAKSGE